MHTSVGKPLPLEAEKGDTLVFNFGLHDYNYGLSGVSQYRDQLVRILNEFRASLPGRPRLIFALTTPAHNTMSPADDVTVQALNQAAMEIMKANNVPTIDLYSPIMKECGPVPFQDSGPRACRLCAPHCKALSVHYEQPGYEFIASIVAEAVTQNTSTTTA